MAADPATSGDSQASEGDNKRNKFPCHGSTLDLADEKSLKRYL